MNTYRDKHLIDVSDPQETLPPDYQAHLDNDPAYQDMSKSITLEDDYEDRRTF